MSQVCANYIHCICNALQPLEADDGDKALSIVSYIGCAISLVCLCLSILFLGYAIYK